MANEPMTEIKVLRSEYQDADDPQWAKREQQLFAVVLETIECAPRAPERWLTVGAWGGVDETAKSRDELIGRYAGRGIDHGEAIALCPCAGHHDECECGAQCQGQCWEDSIAPSGAWQHIVNLANIDPVPVVRGARVGWAAVDWHDHSPGPGGEADLPTVDANDTVYYCGAYDCAGTKHVGDMFREITFDLVDDTGPTAKVLPVSDDALAEITKAWAAAGERARRSLMADLDDPEVHLGADLGPRGVQAAPIPGRAAPARAPARDL